MESVCFVGMDVHKETIEAVVMDVGGREARIEKRLANDMRAVRRFFDRLLCEGAVVAGYEAGCLGFKLHRELTGMGVRCVVIAPSSIARAPGERVKTDRRDALMLAKLLERRRASGARAGALR